MNIIDVKKHRIFSGEITIKNGRIASLVETGPEDSTQPYILPGFIDAHIHIESTLLTPYEFSRIALTHGTVATVSDPHEIGNVLGIDGVKFMIENGKHSKLKFFFGAPSCVPATPFETSGYVIDSNGVEELLQNPDIYFLGEMMNYPGVIFEDKEVLRKIELAHKYNKPVDGHAPLLSGDDLKKYVAKGIVTDHECTNLNEAKEKISQGMYILMREGSAARNLDDLLPLFETNPDKIAFCSDDKLPFELLKDGHINKMVKHAIQSGHNALDVIASATFIPQQIYNLPVGMLQQGDSADYIMIDNLSDFNILETYINGEKVAEHGNYISEPYIETKCPNKFVKRQLSPTDFIIKKENSDIVKAIEIIPNQLLTNNLACKAIEKDNCLLPDVANDLLKIAVVNRYQNVPPAVGFIKNFGLKEGALASSVAHDSHNIVVIGCTDEDLAAACNLVIKNGGGLAAYGKGKQSVLPLPVAGLMSDKNAEETDILYQNTNAIARNLGCPLSAPFTTMSFMSLLVIPSLRLGDKGLFDVNTFNFTSIEI